MIIDLETPLLELDGKTAAKRDTGEGLSLREVCLQALVSIPASENKTPEQAISNWKFAMRVHAGGVVEMTPEEITLLRRRITAVYTDVVAGQACNLLS